MMFRFENTNMLLYGLYKLEWLLFGLVKLQVVLFWIEISEMVLYGFSGLVKLVLSSLEK